MVGIDMIQNKRILLTVRNSWQWSNLHVRQIYWCFVIVVAYNVLDNGNINELSPLTYFLPMPFITEVVS